VLLHPWFGGLKSFADGIYGTLWGDGLFGGLAGGLDRPAWNYDLMAIGYWLALPLTAAVLGGGLLALVRFLRQPRAEWLMLLGLGLLGVSALVQASLASPSCGVVKAFYALSLLVPFCALAAVGLEAAAARSAKVRFLCCILLGVWAMNSYASFWILRSSAPAAILRAKSLADNGRNADAEQTLRTLLQREPRNLDARAMLVSLLVGAGEGQAGAREAEVLARDNPNHAGAQLALARLLALQGGIDQAAEMARKAMDLAPGDARPYECLALLLIKQGRYEEAADVSRAGLAVAPASAELRLALGVALLIDGATNAPAQLQLAFKLQPHLPGAQAILGSALAKVGRSDEAAVQYSDALSADTNNPSLHYELAMIQATAGKLDEATAHLSEAVRLRPDSFQPHCQLAVVLGLQQQTARAVEHYQEALRLNPDCAEALNNLAWIRAANPQPEFRNGGEAVRLAERACQLTDYKQPMLVGTLAAAYAQAGRFPEAMATAEMACSLARQAGNEELLKRNRELLELYRSGKPYREPVASTPPQPSS
jgi:Flp pilus assembly protein TadD